MADIKNSYETVVVFSTKSGEEAIKSLVQKFKDLIEKNATLESIEKIASALNIPLSQLFEKLGNGDVSDSIPLKCYEFLSAKTKAEQEHLYKLLIEMDKYKSK